MPTFADAVADLMSAPKDYQTANDFSNKQPVGPSSDLERILALPRRMPLDLNSAEAEAIVELEMEKYAIDNPNCDCKVINPRKPCLKRLLPVQAWALREISICQGLLGSIATGAGKTVIDILACLALRDCPKPLLLIPPSLVDQIYIDYQMIAQHFRVPGLIINHGPGSPPPKLIPGTVTLNVLPYSRLSLEDESDVLLRLAPTAIIADECDALKDITSTRTKRFLSYWQAGDCKTPEAKEYRRKTKFLGWTGSLADHSILEFGTLATLALRELSPVPLHRDVQEEWAGCLDPSNNPTPPGDLRRLCEPGEDVRHAFRRRLVQTRGFVATEEVAVQKASGDGVIELVIRERKAPPIPEIVERALKMVRNYERPDTLIGSRENDEIEDAMAQARIANEVATGVFYRWKFPPINGVPQREEDVLEWYAARRAWNREVRLKCSEGTTFLDSPKLCETAARRAWGELPIDPKRPVWKAVSWPRWAKIKDKVFPQQEAKLLHPYLIEDAAKWATENRGIVWYSMSEFGRLVAQKAGLRLHTGGPKAGELLRAETGEQSIVASIRSHGRGRDGLQHIFHHQLIANMMASATGFEQLLARGYRRGQKEDQVITELYMHTPELRKSYTQAVERARFVEDILGSKQKLLAGIRSGGLPDSFKNGL